MYSIDPRHPFSRSAWTRLSLMLVGVGALLLVAAPVALAECPLTDPLCVAEQSLESDAPPPPSLPPVPDDVKKAADDAVTKAKGEVDKAVTTVTDTLDELLQPGGDDPGGGGGGRDSGGSGNKPPAGPGDGGRSGTPEGRLPGSGFPGSRLTTPADTTSTPVAFRDQPGLFGQIGDAAVEAAKQLGFPLALAVIVVAFAMIQNYVDRKDPRLALAPIRPEVMRFQ